MTFTQNIVCLYLHRFCNTNDTAKFKFQRSPGVSGNFFDLSGVFDDKSSFKFQRRERPELLFDENGTLVQLYTAVNLKKKNQRTYGRFD